MQGQTVERIPVGPFNVRLQLQSLDESKRIAARDGLGELERRIAVN